MNANNPTESDKHFLFDPTEPESFITYLSGRFEGSMKERFGSIIVQNNMWDFAVGLSLHQDHRVAFRGSWALEWAYYNDKESFKPYANVFLENFLKSENTSVHRIYTKMLCDMVCCKTLILSESQTEKVIEKLFGLLIDPKTKSAVKAWCMELLFDLSTRSDWVEESLRETVRDILQNQPSKSMANYCGKLLRRMDKRS